jgi:hypothetical protein
LGEASERVEARDGDWEEGEEKEVGVEQHVGAGCSRGCARRVKRIGSWRSDLYCGGELLGERRSD